ncbi:RecB family exonuclease [Thermodesulfobacteriota bacterium]
MIHISRKQCTEPKKKKKRWLSPSSINAYLRCPRSFYLSKIAKRKQKPSIHLIRGIAVHNAVGEFYKRKLHRCGTADYSDLKNTVIDLFEDEWDDQKDSLLECKLSLDDIEFFMADSRNMMVNFLHDLVKGGGFEKEAPTIEKMLFSKKYLLLGRIDAIHNSRDPPLLIDFKTCKSKEVTEDYKRQLGIYALLYKENFNILPDVGIHFLKFQDGLETFQITNDYVDEIRGFVLDLHAKTQSENIEDYPCKCGWCKKNFGNIEAKV